MALTKKVERELREIARTATMETASFNDLTEGNVKVVLRHANGAEIETGQNVTDFIRERTRIWRNSWVVNPLRAILGEDV